MAIYQTRNTGMGNRERNAENAGNAGMFTRIPRNVREDSGECSRRFRGMFKKIPGNVRADSRECSGRFRGMFKKIAVNLNFDLILEIVLAFYQILLLNC